MNRLKFSHSMNSLHNMTNIINNPPPLTVKRECDTCVILSMIESIDRKSGEVLQGVVHVKTNKNRRRLRFMLGRHTFPVVQYIMQVLILGKLHLLTERVARRHVFVIFVAFPVEFESLPDAVRRFAVIFWTGRVAQVVVLSRQL